VLALDAEPKTSSHHRQSNQPSPASMTEASFILSQDVLNQLQCMALERANSSG
jgi:hypothetical protein